MSEILRIAKANYQLAKEKPRESNPMYLDAVQEIWSAAGQGRLFVQLSRIYDQEDYRLLKQAVELLEEEGFTVHPPTGMVATASKGGPKCKLLQSVSIF